MLSEVRDRCHADGLPFPIEAEGVIVDLIKRKCKQVMLILVHLKIDHMSCFKLPGASIQISHVKYIDDDKGGACLEVRLNNLRMVDGPWHDAYEVVSRHKSRS